MDKTTRNPLRAGDEVVVRPPEEILATLDSDGTLGGMPFMGEMVDLCGQHFRVARRIEKTCLERQRSRRFTANDVLLLEDQRCSGSHHDGCARGCMLFWKEAWLRSASPGESPLTIDMSRREELRKHLTAKSDATHYFCQSTQLKGATAPFLGNQTAKMIPVALREIRSGSRSVMEVVGLMAHWTRMRVRRLIFGGDRMMHGPLKRTPIESLGLKPGEWVRVKSRSEILNTLNHKEENRGLGISHAMTRFCGDRFQVERRVDRMISELTSEMREVKNTVALHGMECICYYKCLGCPRGDLLYWREIWLERDPPPASDGRSDDR